jgi:hypothetical protein
MSNFDAASVAALFSAVTSALKQTALFQKIDVGEPKSPPGTRLYCSVMLGPMRAVPSSGLNSTSGQVTILIRIWSKAEQRPLEKIDPEIASAAALVMGTLSGRYTLGGIARNIDLFQMTATPGWIEFENESYRVCELSVPIVINDMFAQVA